MATTEVGNRSVPVTRMEALANELRLLKCAMADMQGRLDTVLIEIGAELEHVHAKAEPSSATAPEWHEPQVIAERPADIEPAIRADTQLLSPTHAIEEQPIDDLFVDAEPEAQIETTETAIASVVEACESNLPAIEPAGIELADIAAPAETAEPATETPAIAEAAETATEIVTEPIALADIAAEPLAEAVAEPLTAGTQAIETLSTVVVLADRRTKPRKTQSAIDRVGRWAAIIALIAIAAAVATGTGLAGHGELLTVSRVCALSGEVCSIVPGIP